MKHSKYKSLLFTTLIMIMFSMGCTHNNNFSNTVVDLHLYNDVGQRNYGNSELPSKLPSPHDRTLRDYIEQALLHNEKLKSAFEEWKASLMKIPQVKALPDPKFTYAYYIERVETRVGPQKQRFAISQTFPWLSKLMLAGHVATAEAQMKKAQYEAIKWDIITKVKKTFFDYVYLLNAVNIMRDNLEFLKHLEMAIQTKYASATEAYGSLLRLQMEMGRLEDRVKSLEDLLEPTRAELNALLSRPAHSPISLPRNIKWPGKISLSEKEALEKMRKQNPELKILEARIEKVEKSFELSKKQFYPDLTLSLSTIDTGEAKNSSVDDSGKNPIVLGFSLNIPLWWNKYEAAIHEARLKLQAAKKEYEDRKFTLEATLKKAFFNWKDAERKIDLYKNGLIPKANQAFQVSLNSYETGKMSYTDVIDVERTLLQFQLNLEEAKTKKAKWLAEIEKVIGEQVVTEWTTH